MIIAIKKYLNWWKIPWICKKSEAEKEKLKVVKEVVERIKSDKKVKRGIERIKSHECVKVIERERK